MRLDEIAWAVSGDKGDVSNVCVFPYDDSDYEFLGERLTEARVATHFRSMVRGQVRRYELPGLCGLNFVMDQALGGGVSRSLRTDPHGKSVQSYVLLIELGERT